MQILHEAIAKYENIRPETLYKTIYESSLIAECTHFRPIVASSVYQFFRAKRILDPSAGWGDRLIAVMANDENILCYHAVDPNGTLSQRYQKIIDFFEKYKYQIFNQHHLKILK